MILLFIQQQSSFPVLYSKCVKLQPPAQPPTMLQPPSLISCTCKNSKMAMLQKHNRGCKRWIIVSCSFQGSHAEMI